MGKEIQEKGTSALKTNISRRHVLAGVGVGAATSVAVAQGAYAASSSAPILQTGHGPVRGQRQAGVSVFKGIRYGADTAPTRFEKPQAPRAWTSVKDAFEYGDACPQRRENKSESEDCLFLNVWTPASAKGDNLADGGNRPIMVYFHGGAYNNGSGSSPLYDGQYLANKGDVVVITVNHRLNAFGYLYLPLLMDGAFPDSGNAGIWDLVLALKWVKNNARNFGGDPDRVMVFGQSGGGAKIATMMAAPAAKGLFHSAATMSGQQVTASGPLNATQRAEAYLEALSITPGDVEAIKAVPFQKMVERLTTPDPVNTTRGLYFGPVLDERFLMRHPFWPDAPAQSANIPMLLGNTHDETRTLVGRREPESFSLEWEDLPPRLSRHLRCDILPQHVVDTYRKTYPDYSASDVFFAAVTAGRSWRGQWEEAEVRAKQAEAMETAPTWVYQMDFGSPIDDGKWGASHAFDIPLAFGNIDKQGSRTGISRTAVRVADELSQAMINLATHGDPNHDGLASWKPYLLEHRETMVFDEHTKLISDPRGAERRLFSKVPFTQWGT